jgi:hypothetical protein
MRLASRSADVVVVRMGQYNGGRTTPLLVSIVLLPTLSPYRASLLGSYHSRAGRQQCRSKHLYENELEIQSEQKGKRSALVTLHS